MDRSLDYQVKFLQAELTHVSEEMAAVPAPVRALCRHGRNFYWTASRLFGALKPRGDDAPGRALMPPIPASIETLDNGLYFDITETWASAGGAGIQRVMRKLCAAAVADRLARPVVARNGRLVGLPGGKPIEFKPGDKVLLLDSSWQDLHGFTAAVAAACAQGADIVFGAHDVIPATTPAYVTLQFTAQFRAWLARLLPLCASAVAVSRDSAVELSKWMQAADLEVSPDMKIGWFRLGADFAGGASVASTPALPEAGGRPYFLTVGTVEPRKAHTVALDAFERVWAAGHDVAWVIAGRPAYNSEALKARIADHPEYGRRLFWKQSAGDDDLVALYRGAHAVVLPTMAEGFGLPLVEAAHHGAPVIASDLAVFREIAGDGFVAFEPGNAVALSARIAEAARVRPAPAAIAEISWRKSAATLFGMIAGDGYQATAGGLRQD